MLVRKPPADKGQQTGRRLTFGSASPPAICWWRIRRSLLAYTARVPSTTGPVLKPRDVSSNRICSLLSSSTFSITLPVSWNTAPDERSAEGRPLPSSEYTPRTATADQPHTPQPHPRTHSSAHPSRLPAHKELLNEMQTISCKKTLHLASCHTEICCRIQLLLTALDGSLRLWPHSSVVDCGFAGWWGFWGREGGGEGGRAADCFVDLGASAALRDGLRLLVEERGGRLFSVGYSYGSGGFDWRRLQWTNDPGVFLLGTDKMMWELKAAWSYFGWWGVREGPNSPFTWDFSWKIPSLFCEFQRSNESKEFPYVEWKEKEEWRRATGDARGLRAPSLETEVLAEPALTSVWGDEVPHFCCQRMGFSFSSQGRVVLLELLPVSSYWLLKTKLFSETFYCTMYLLQICGFSNASVA